MKIGSLVRSRIEFAVDGIWIGMIIDIDEEGRFHVLWNDNAIYSHPGFEIKAVA